MELVKTKRAVYEVTPSIFKPIMVFNVVRTSNTTGKKRMFEAWKHQVDYWKRVNV